MITSFASLSLAAVLTAGETSVGEPVIVPLFSSHTVIHLTVNAEFRRVARERDPEASYEATVLHGADLHEAKIEVRGNNRLRSDVCRFPPLRLDFGRSSTEGLFRGQNRLKLVTECNPGTGTASSLVVREYLAYRLLNSLTDFSFRVRLVNLSVVDAGRSQQQMGFLIESRPALARRLGVKPYDVLETRVSALDAEALNRLSVFQFYIANTDWSATFGGNAECCHNVKLFHTPDDRVIPVAYDFDYSGLVHAPYAGADDSLNQSSVLDRVYQGYCDNNPLLANVSEQLDELARLLVRVVDAESLEPAVHDQFPVRVTAEVARMASTCRREVANPQE